MSRIPHEIRLPPVVQYIALAFQISIEGTVNLVHPKDHDMLKRFEEGPRSWIGYVFTADGYVDLNAAIAGRGHFMRRAKAIAGMEASFLGSTPSNTAHLAVDASIRERLRLLDGSWLDPRVHFIPLEVAKYQADSPLFVQLESAVHDIVDTWKDKRVPKSWYNLQLTDQISLAVQRGIIEKLKRKVEQHASLQEMRESEVPRGGRPDPGGADFLEEAAQATKQQVTALEMTLRDARARAEGSQEVPDGPRPTPPATEPTVTSDPSWSRVDSPEASPDRSSPETSGSGEWGNCPHCIGRRAWGVAGYPCPMCGLILERTDGPPPDFDDTSRSTSAEVSPGRSAGVEGQREEVSLSSSLEVDSDFSPSGSPLVVRKTEPEQNDETAEKVVSVLVEQLKRELDEHPPEVTEQNPFRISTQ